MAQFTGRFFSTRREGKLRVKNNKKREQEEEELGCEEEAVGARVHCRGVHRRGSTAAAVARRCAAPSLCTRLLFSLRETPFLCVLLFFLHVRLRSSGVHLVSWAKSEHGKIWTGQKI